MTVLEQNVVDVADGYDHYRSARRMVTTWTDCEYSDGGDEGQHRQRRWSCPCITDNATFSITVKNTFIELEEDATASQRPDRRLQTLPSQWRPLEVQGEDCDCSDGVDKHKEQPLMQMPFDVRRSLSDFCAIRNERLTMSETMSFLLSPRRKLSSWTDNDFGDSVFELDMMHDEDGHKFEPSDALSDVSTQVSPRSSTTADPPQDYWMLKSSDSSALVRSGLLPTALAPLDANMRTSWASCTLSPCGDEDEYNFGFAETPDVISPMSERLAAALVPPPPQAMFPRSTVSAKATEFVPRGVKATCSSSTTAPSQKNENTGHQEKYEMVVAHVKRELMACTDLVFDVTVAYRNRGWAVTAFVKRKQPQEKLDSLKERAQQALLDAVEKVEHLYVLGDRASPFAPLNLSGFACALAVMPDPENACWDAYSKGFCSSPGSCKFQHPMHQAGVNVYLQPVKKLR